ncbi:MAG: DoxX family membrane protein [Phycisphaerales bacterium]|nr:DoxX family membrane protein [Phycisphaerales bacterium]
MTGTQGSCCKTGEGGAAADNGGCGCKGGGAGVQVTTSCGTGSCGAMSGAGLVWGVVALALRLGVAAVFLTAAYMKLRPAPGPMAMSGPQDFSGAIKAFRLGLPDEMIRLTTSAVPWTEAICGVLLLIGLWTRAAATVAALLLTGFTALIASALARDLSIKCGCFGEAGLICHGPISACKYLENGIFIAAAVAVMLTPRHLVSVDDGVLGRRRW